MTHVYYKINLKTGIITDFDSEISDSDKTFVRPGRTLWEAHPKQAESLESLFARYLSTVYKVNINCPYVAREHGGFTYVNFDEEIAHYENIVPTLNYDELQKSIHRNILDTWKSIAKDTFNIHMPHFILNALSRLDVLEPTHSEEALDQDRYDAFTFWVTEVWHKNPELFLVELDDLIHLENFHPIQ